MEAFPSLRTELTVASNTEIRILEVVTGVSHAISPSKSKKSGT